MKRDISGKEVSELLTDLMKKLEFEQIQFETHDVIKKGNEWGKDNIIVTQLRNSVAVFLNCKKIHRSFLGNNELYQSFEEYVNKFVKEQGSAVRGEPRIEYREVIKADLSDSIRKYEEARKLERKYDNELFDKFVSPILQISDEMERNNKLAEIICELPRSLARHSALEILFALDEKLGIKRKCNSL